MERWILLGNFNSYIDDVFDYIIKMKILNLYAGIGGNRKLWSDEHEVTAVEINPHIAKIYQDNFPNDEMFEVEAHEFLLKNYYEYDFIWSSPPCPTHSRIRNEAGVGVGQNKPVYPDMKLYEEIIFLNYNFKGKWVVENVIGYYKPLIRPIVYREHYFWANFVIDGKKNMDRGHMGTMEDLRSIKKFDLSKYKKDIDERKLLRNCTESETGLYIFNCAFKIKQKTLNGGD